MLEIQLVLLTLTLVALFFAVYSSGEDASHPAAEKGFVTEWLVCGPFPTQPDMLYIDYLEGVGGEQHLVPHPGLQVERPDGEVLEWEAHQAQDNGLVNFVGLVGPSFAQFWDLKDRVAYAYTCIETQEEQRVVLALGSEDQIQIWLNGELLHLSLASRTARPAQEIVAADLQAGANHLLVKVARRSGQWGFFLQQLEPEFKLFANQTELVGGSPHDEEQYFFLPDLYVGERTEAWGYVPVTNISTRPLEQLRLSVEGNDVVEPTSSEVVSIQPGETRKLQFQLRTRRPVQASDRTEVVLSIQVEDEVHELRVEPRLRAPGEYFATSYVSRADNSIQPFRIIAPPDYDPDRSYGLVVCMHGYKGDDSSYTSCTPKPWTLIATPCARGQVPYKEIGTWDVLEVMEAMQQRYSIDAERIYLTGHSMGGRGTWVVGLHYPDRFAVLAPVAGSNDWAKPIAENGLNVPTFVIHGAEDQVVNPEYSREIVALFKELGNPVKYKEVPGADHWWLTQVGDREVAPPDDPEVFEFFAQHRLQRYPREVVYKTESLRFNQAYWTRIEQIEVHGKMARLRARVEPGNRIAVEAENITEYTLSLNDSLVDMNAEVVIETNGQPSFAGSPPAEVAITCDEEEKWGFVAKGDLQPEGLRKRPDLCGPTIEAFNSPFVLVYGTSGSSADTRINFQQARWAQVWWQIWANGHCQIKADNALIEEDLAAYNLILYGNASSNQVVARINDELPIRFENGAVVAGEERFEEEEVALQMLYPNSLNPDRFAVINGGVTSRGTAHIHKTGMDVASEHFPSATDYDYAVFDPTFIGKTEGRYLKAGFFDGQWQLQE